MPAPAEVDIRYPGQNVGNNSSVVLDKLIVSHQAAFPGAW
jgi:hypothetical protein